MTRVTLDLRSIRAVLEAGGRPCHRVSDDTFRTLVHGARSGFPVLVRLDPAGFVVFAIVPFLRSPADEGQAARLYARLLELNHELLMARFSIDDDLDVMLSAEYALADLDRSEVEDALDVLAFYADRHHEALGRVAAPPRGGMRAPTRTPG